MHVVLKRAVGMSRSKRQIGVSLRRVILAEVLRSAEKNPENQSFFGNGDVPNVPRLRGVKRRVKLCLVAAD
jgi:hypothetical protein